ncbi:hypothetical protein M422DRAFT_238682 [Sphaerobolus stellatus SS14]|nr:hypothetical protein M422DRAFT_238682 [Sphaerobolus stellatus SS14]
MLSVELHTPPFRSRLELLSKCQNLRSLKLTWSRWHDIHGLQYDSLDCGTFKFLQLESLDLSLNMEDDFLLDENLFEVPQLHNSQLQELKIIGSDSEEYQDILIPLTELRMLVLAKCRPSTAFFSSFTPRPEDTKEFLPNLREPIIKEPHPGFVISRTLLRIVKAWMIQERGIIPQFHIWTENPNFLQTHGFFSTLPTVLLTRSVSLQLNHLKLKTRHSEILENILFGYMPPLFNTPGGVPRIHDLMSFEGAESLDNGKGFDSTLAKDFTMSHSSAIETIKSSWMAACKEWRDVVHRSRKLWSRLEIDVYALMKELGRRRLEKLLKYSGTLTIDVKLIFMLKAEDAFTLAMDESTVQKSHNITVSFLRQISIINVL